MTTNARRTSDTPAAENGNGQTSAAAPPSNPLKPSASNLPPAKPGTDVDVKVMLNYESTAEGIAQNAAPPKVSPEQLAEIQRRNRAPHGKRIEDLGEWLDYWRDYQEAFGIDDEFAEVSKFKMSVVRLIDDIPLPGQPSPFLNVCTEERHLGTWNFTTDENRFIAQLQTLNSSSGGRFRVSLRDADGEYIRKAWLDNRGNPIEGFQNSTWQGSIPNPLGTQNPQRERQPKPQEDELTTLAKDMLKKRLEKVISGEDEKPAASNSLLDSVNATAAATVISKMGDALSAVAESASKHTGGEDKGFLRSLAEGDEGQRRLWAGVDNIFALGSSVAGDWLKNRAAERAAKLELEKLKLLKDNPQLAEVYRQQTAAAPPQAEEDVYDYIMRACEERRTDFDIRTDTKIQGMNAGDLTLVRGALVKEDATPEEVLDKFITVCAFKGKGERAKKLKELPHATQFIERLQRQARGE